MSKALHEFLALRQASEAGLPATADRHDPYGGEGKVENPGKAVVVSSDADQTQAPAETQRGQRQLKPDSGVNERELAAYFVDLLAAHPSGRPVADRRGLAHYLARGVIHRYGDPSEIRWQSETSPPRLHQRDDALWIAQCPAGHLTDEVIESHQVLGWSCKACQRVYDATECRLVPRLAVGGTGPEGSGGAQ